MRILKEWQSFEKDVVPREAPVIQREECRRAFYAGAAALFAVMMDITKFDDDEVCGQASVWLVMRSTAGDCWLEGGYSQRASAERRAARLLKAYPHQRFWVTRERVR